MAESHDEPTAAHRGACIIGSNTAVCAPPPAAGLTVRERSARRVRPPLVPWAEKEKLPGVAAGEAATVRVLEAAPFGGGAAEAGAGAPGDEGLAEAAPGRAFAPEDPVPRRAVDRRPGQRHRRVVGGGGERRRGGGAPAAAAVLGRRGGAGDAVAVERRAVDKA